MKNTKRLLFASLTSLLLVVAAPGQTRGVNYVNRCLITDAAAFYFPPALVACPAPIALAAGVPMEFRVHTPAAGLPVHLIMDLGPTIPGAACLAAVPLAIPACLGPCAGLTNQSRDLGAPFLAVFPGVSVVNPAGGGYFALPFVPPAVPAGIQISVQAVIGYAPAPAGFLMSNAFTVWV